ncbi:MAG: translation initiation factor IF-3 [Alphaproteobacteria bacterium GM7ARS4]|nr:translation initiation factor IF-3 [Alphaproteobacteria bacterium GM7ARS4]
MNGDIRAESVRVIGVDGEMVGVMGRGQALAKAQERGLDLVEVSPHARPPVCRIIDYGKFRYREQKKRTELRRKQKHIELKEIKMRPNIDAHDYAFKMRSMKKFLSHGDKVKVTVWMRGRERAHQGHAFDVLGRVAAEIADMASIETAPQAESGGRQVLMIVTPQRKKKEQG